MPQFGLIDVWGKRHLELPMGAVDLSGANTDIASLERLFRRMPGEKLYVRVTGPQVDSGPPRRITLSDVPDLAARLHTGEPLHLQAIDLQAFDAGFARALERFVEQVGAEVPEACDRRTHTTIGLFLSTPGAIAPFHADHEHNFLSQIVGDKRMHVFPPDDLDLFPCLARETLACDGIHVLSTYKPAFETRGAVVCLSPGRTVYHPPMGPHWVDTGTQSYSLSVSLSFTTPGVTRTLLLHKANRRLRRLGFSPAPVGHASLRDDVKYAIARLARGVTRLGRGD